MAVGFRKFLEDGEGRVWASFSHNTVGTHNDAATAAFLPTTWTGSEDLGVRSNGMPGTDIQVPSVTRRARIRSVEKNRDPIRITLMDGTVLHLTLDEFRRADSRTKMEKGREITVAFQRREDDGSADPSQIISIG